jgi:hypothetical protein
MFTVNFTPTVIGPNFELSDNYNWLKDYMESHNKIPKYFWNDKYIPDLKIAVRSPCILKVSKRLNHVAFSNQFRKEWKIRTEANTPQELRVEFNLNETKFVRKRGSKEESQFNVDIKIIAIKGNPIDIHSYFSVMLYKDHSICLIDDFYPCLYDYGWGGSGAVILPNLERYIKYNIPFTINSIYVCSISETYGFWKKMGYQMAEENNWGNHIKYI